MGVRGGFLGDVCGGGGEYHFMYFLWSFIITSMKSSTVAGMSCQQMMLGFSV